jgi:hypothetical protein
MEYIYEFRVDENGDHYVSYKNLEYPLSSRHDIQPEIILKYCDNGDLVKLREGIYVVEIENTYDLASFSLNLIPLRM